MLPARNRRDLDDIPADARERVRIEWLETVDDALRIGVDAGRPGRFVDDHPGVDRQRRGAPRR
jgi:hypothetical protein